MISHNEQQAKFRALNEWFLSNQGVEIIKAFTNELSFMAPLFHGETLLQLGSCANNQWLCKFRYQHKLLVSPYMTQQASLISLFHQLPFNKESVDCVVAPLTMDAFTHGNKPIDEIDRLLKPQGYVVFFGINPISPWGYWLKTARHTCFGVAPAKPTSVFFLKRAVLYRGYIQCYLSNFYYIPPVKNKNLIAKFKILNAIGKMISPIPAGFYCFIVQKQQEGLIPLPKIEEEFTPAAV